MKSEKLCQNTEKKTKIVWISQFHADLIGLILKVDVKYAKTSEER